MNYKYRIKHQFESVMKRENQTITDYFTGTEYKVFFRTKSRSKDTTEQLRLYYAEDVAIDNGTIFRYKNENYVAINKQADESNIFYTSIAQKCTQTITNNGMTLPCAISNIEITTNGNQVVSTIDGTAVLYTCNNANYKKLPLGTKINALGNTYEIKNKYEDNGLGYLKLEQAGRIPDVYLLTYMGTNSLSMDDTVYQLTYKATVNGTEVENPTIMYVSSDETVATIDTSGVMTMIKAGTVTITASWEGISTDTVITISEETPVVPKITCDITCVEAIVKVGGAYKTFTALFYDADNTDITATVTPVWSTYSEDFDTASVLTISNTTPTKYKIKITDDHREAVGKSFTLTLTDATGICTKSIVVEVEAYS